MSSRVILVTGATGKQGGAVINALLSAQARDIKIFGVTRSKTSKAAQNLLLRGVYIVEGDLTVPDAIFAQTGPVWGVFSIQPASPGLPTEETQGKALVDSALAHGVRHFVYTSGDRGGPVRSPSNPTGVGNLLAKHNVERHLEAAVRGAGGGMSYAILRPVTFFENLERGVHGQGFARMWEQIGDKRLQLVSCRDIGWFAAQALLFPRVYAGKALSLAGDELTQPEAAGVYREVLGREMPIAPCIVGKGVKFFKKEAVGTMFAWLEKEGYGADVGLCREINPGMQDFRAWLKDPSNGLLNEDGSVVKS